MENGGRQRLQTPTRLRSTPCRSTSIVGVGGGPWLSAIYSLKYGSPQKSGCSIMTSKCLKTLIAGVVLVTVASFAAADEIWKKHVVHEGLHTATAVGGDFTGDGKPDVISNSGSK